MSVISIPQTWRRYKTSYRLSGALCVHCGRTYLPPRPVCLQCKSRDFDDYTFSGRGTIVTYTIVRNASITSEMQEQETLCVPIPYILAIVELEEGPRITAQIVDAAPEAMRIGAAVSVVFRKLSVNGEAGVIRYGFKFRLAE